jgi:hypothetical protein
MTSAVTQFKLALWYNCLIFDTVFVMTCRWMPDDEAHTCPLCNQKFNQLRRKHHCRQCGRVLCNKCCSEKVRTAYALCVASNSQPWFKCMPWLSINQNTTIQWFRVFRLCFFLLLWLFFNLESKKANLTANFNGFEGPHKFNACSDLKNCLYALVYNRARS